MVLEYFYSFISRLVKKSQFYRLSSLDFNIVMARILCVPLFRGKIIPSRFSVMFLLSYLSIFLFNLIYVGFEIYDLILVRANMVAVAQNASLTITHLGGNIKLFNVFFRLNAITNVMNTMKYIPNIYAVTEKQKNVYKESEKQNKFVILVYSTTVIVTTGWTFILLLKDPSIGGKLLPYSARLPDFLPISVKIAYWYIASVLLGLQIVATDSLSINMMNQIRSQLKILNLAVDELKSVNKLQKSPVVMLTDCIKHHEVILNLRNDVEKIIRFPILIQFVASLFIFVLTGFQAIVLAGSFNVVVIYMYSSGILVQLFSCCWFAHHVMEQNKSLAMVGYNSDWYIFGKTYSKVLLIFMIRAQSPLTFTVGGFFDLSLTTFTGILGKSYSYVAVLRQMYTNELRTSVN